MATMLGSGRIKMKDEKHEVDVTQEKIFWFSMFAHGVSEIFN